MSFCKYNCGTGFNSIVEREEHEKLCNSNPLVIEAGKWLETLTPKEKREALLYYKINQKLVVD